MDVPVLADEQHQNADLEGCDFQVVVLFNLSS